MRLLLVFGPVSYFILILTSNATQGLCKWISGFQRPGGVI